jgi:predicted nuclease of restriction endonuclease-like (RecB) superfamily
MEVLPYKDLLATIKTLIQDARHSIAKKVNNEILQTYWLIGKAIVEYEQSGKERADYGKELIINLSKRLTVEIGKGFSRSNLIYMRLFYLNYPNFQISVTVSHLLTWSHYYELLKIDDPLERSFYEQQSISEIWTIRELRRQKKTLLFHRLAASKDAEGVLKLSKSGQVLETEEDIIKEPYVLEFLGIPEHIKYSESDLEQRIINNLQLFLLEMGKGFAFLDRQFRIPLNNKNYYVDLVFYHRILKCFVLIDLKINDVEHYDIGQMNMYLNYFATEQNMPDDNPPIGIILAKEKDEVLVEYALGGITNNIFVSKYELYLPDRQLLESRVRRIIDQA